MRKTFKAGDEVFALFTTPTIKVGQKVIIEKVTFCSGCGFQKVSLGEPVERTISKCNCGSLRRSESKQWYKAENFATKETLASDLTIAVKMEDYETASVLRDLIISIQD